LAGFDEASDWGKTMNGSEIHAIAKILDGAVVIAFRGACRVSGRRLAVTASEAV